MSQALDSAPNRVLNGLAATISAVSSPFLVVPYFCLQFISQMTTQFEDFFYWSLLCVFLSSAVPAVYILALWKSGRITDVHIALREQRKGPFVASMLSFMALTLLLLTSGAPRPLVGLSAVLLGNSVVFGLLSNRWKVSLHTGVLGAGITGAVMILGWSPSAFLLLVPVIWARRLRGRHTLAQGLVGSGLGALITALVFSAAS